MSKLDRYDTIIVGSGPAGIFAALELIKYADGKLRIGVFEQGGSLNERFKLRQYIQGWGGAGLFADGKITISTEIGGWLNQIVEETTLEKIIYYVDKIWGELSPESRVLEPNMDSVQKLISEARKYHIKLVPYRVRHIGSDNTRYVLERAWKIINKNAEIHLHTRVDQIERKDNGFVVTTDKNKKYWSKYLIIAPGRTGAQWLRAELQKLGAPVAVNPVDIGVRIEVPYETLQKITEVLYDPKFIFTAPTYDDKVRTFCVNPYGFVIREKYEDVITTNGHSFANKKSENTNLAILVSSYFTEPFKDPIAYGKHIAKLANLLAGGNVLIQRLGDLKKGRRSTPTRIARSIVKPTLEDATPGDISFALPHRHLVSILEFLKALDNIAPGIYSDNTLVYAVEVKFYSSRAPVNKNLEVKNIKNLFVCGDGAGITRGLAQSSVSGIIAARTILTREGFKVE